MIPEDDGTTEDSQELRPYSTLLIACAIAAGKLGARFVSRSARAVFATTGAASTHRAAPLVLREGQS
ncbi:MAG: hypothetical protein ABSE49_06860 [Polyangiaceae bacterium]|jgi:hypothetical protein